MAAAKSTTTETPAEKSARKAANRKTALQALEALGIAGEATITLSIGDVSFTLPARPMVFESGSVGFNVTEKIPVGAERLQVGTNLIVVGSKGLHSA